MGREGGREERGRVGARERGRKKGGGRVEVGRETPLTLVHSYRQVKVLHSLPLQTCVAHCIGMSHSQCGRSQPRLSNVCVCVRESVCECVCVCKERVTLREKEDRGREEGRGGGDKER